MAVEEGLRATEESILDAANRCVARFGIRRTTVEDVAREAGVSRGSVYRYFKDKEAIVRAVVLRNMGAFFDDLRRRLDRKPSFEAKLAEAAVMARGYRETDPIYAGLAATEPETLAVLLTTRAEDFVRACIDFLIPYIAEAKASGELRGDLDEKRAAEWCVRMILSLITTPSPMFDVEDPVQVRRFIGDHLVKGLAP